MMFLLMEACEVSYRDMWCKQKLNTGGNRLYFHVKEELRMIEVWEWCYC